MIASTSGEGVTQNKTIYRIELKLKYSWKMIDNWIPNQYVEVRPYIVNEGVHL
jgi:hypothetical protein